MPTAFNYKGRCLMEILRQEQRALGVDPSDEQLSPSKNADLKLKGQYGSADSKVLAMSPGRSGVDIEVDSMQDSMVGL